MFSWLTLYTLMKLPEIKDQLPAMMAYLHTWSSELMPFIYKILPTVVSSCLNPDAPQRPELCVLVSISCHNALHTLIISLCFLRYRSVASILLDVGYVASLWVLPTPQKILAVGSDQDMSYPVIDCIISNL